MDRVIALTVVTLSRGPTTARVLGLFALTASRRSDGRGIALLPPLAVVLLVGWWHFRPEPRDVVRWLGGGLALLGVALVAFRLYTSGNGGGALYGGQVAAFQQHSLNVREFLSYLWQFYLPPLPVLEQRLGPPYGFRQVFVETFFGTFGSLDVQFPGRVYALLQVGSVFGLVALYTAAVVRWRELRARWDLLLALLAVGLTGIVFLHVVSYLALVGGPDPIVVGRYLLPLIALRARRDVRRDLAAATARTAVRRRRARVRRAAPARRPRPDRDPLLWLSASTATASQSRPACSSRSC